MRSSVPGQGLWQAARLALGTAAALGLARFAYGLLLPAMRDDLHWSLAEAGVMSTANGIGYLVGALVTASVVRRVGAAATFRCGMALTAVALGATAAGDDFLALLLARAAAGAAGAAVFITGGVIASRIASRVASGTPITVYFAGTGLGIVFSAATIPALAEHWRLAWIGLGVAAGAASLGSWSAAGSEHDTPTRAGGRARIGPLWAIALAYLLFAAGYITYITFLSAYLADRHAPIGQLVLTWTALGLAVVAAPALWSRPTSHWSDTRALATMLGVLAGGAALALAAPTPPVILASAIAYGATFMGVPAAVTALIRANTSPADWTATLAAFTMLFAVGQTAGPWIAGVVADHTSTGATVVWTAILCAAAAGIAAVAGRSRPSTRQRGTVSSRRPSDARVP